MHNSYFFLHHLAPELHEHLQGLELISCFSQERDELVAGFASPKAEVWLKISLSAQLQLMQFPRGFHRTRGASIDLFKPLVGKKVQSVQVVEWERALVFSFNDNFTWVLKLYGSRSNLVLLEAEKVTEVFHKRFEADWELPQLEPQLQGFATAEQIAERGVAAYKHLTKEAKAELESRWAGAETAELKAEVGNNFLKELLAAKLFYISKFNNKYALLLFDAGEIFETSSSAIEATNLYARAYYGRYLLEREQQKLLQQLSTLTAKTERYLEQNQQRLQQLQSGNRYEEFGHLLMANLHAIPPDAREAEVEDLYKGGSVKIPIKPKLNAQQMAAEYYRKGKNQQKEVAEIQRQIESKETLYLQLAEWTEAAETATDIRSLRKLAAAVAPQTGKQQQEHQPWRTFQFQGYQILVGKNATGNDQLTTKVAKKNDLWLHARSATGSHVVVRQQAGQPFPKPVIEKAAQLAAWYSQRQHDTLCPVSYTPKKYIHKIKGAPAGAVKMLKEEVLLVQPLPFDSV